MNNAREHRSDSLLTRFVMAVRTDFPRWSTIASGIAYAAVASYASVASYFQWREADLRDLLLVLFISAGWTWLWVSIVRFLDTMKIKALGFPLLILFAIVTIGNNMFDISKTVTPIAINSFPYGGLLSLDLRDIVVIVGVVAITVSTAVSVLRPSRLSGVYSWLLDGIATVGSEPSRYLAILVGVLWAGESYSRFVDAGEVFFRAKNVGFFGALDFQYAWNRIDGTYILYLEAIVLVLMILYANRMQARSSLRIAALLGCCAVVVIAYAVSFPWPSEVSPGLGLPSPDYGPLAWSAPSLILLIGSAVVAIFKRVND